MFYSAASVLTAPVETTEQRQRVQALSTHRSRLMKRLAFALATLLILSLGAVENLYGNTDAGDVYGSDAVQYLDIARAMERGDWHSALNPLWSQGYPALLAAARPLAPVGPGGNWTTIRIVNFSIFAANYAAFIYLLLALLGNSKTRPSQRKHFALVWIAGLSLFVTTQICFGQVSRVNPDELVTTLFFLACGMIVRLLHPAQLQENVASSRKILLFGALLGLVLGIGFIVKAVFLVLGCGMLAIVVLALWRARRSFLPVIAAAIVFAVFAGSYGVALSHAVGKPTLGESGAINYAWHVDRLHKWVHWEGGVEPAATAWPKPWIARFAQWDAQPPNFGTPLHPSAILQQSPLVYGFSAPIHATYVPYYDPPYWYEGFRHVVRVRYQLIAIVKSVVDLLQALRSQPIFFAVLMALGILLSSREARQSLRVWLRDFWPLVACALLGVMIYLPVHLEGRYLAGFLAALALCAIAGSSVDSASLKPWRARAAASLLLLGLAGDLAIYQRPVWHNLLTHRSPHNNVDWQIGEAVTRTGLAPMSQVGVISWTANLHCDWAYIAQLQITSEIASGDDYNLFWKLPAEKQLQTLSTFRKAGAIAVFTYAKPDGAGDGNWKQLGQTPMWMYKF